MTEQVIELLYRNLQEVFGEGDAALPRAAIDEFYMDSAEAGKESLHRLGDTTDDRCAAF